VTRAYFLFKAVRLTAETFTLVIFLSKSVVHTGHVVTGHRKMKKERFCAESKKKENGKLKTNAKQRELLVTE
jgi:hypothetical protein